MYSIMRQKNKGFTPHLWIFRKHEKTECYKGAGFTLIEMIIVAMIFSVIGLAIVGVLSNGIIIWQRVNQEVAQEDVSIFFDRFSRELRNTFLFTTMNLEGAQDSISFPTIVASRGPNNVPVYGIGRVNYYYDKYNMALIRESKNYSQIYQSKGGHKQELLKGIDSLLFQYYFYDQELRDYFWLDEAGGADLPLAVRVQLQLRSDSGVETIVRTIDIPLAQYREE